MPDDGAMHQLAPYVDGLPNTRPNKRLDEAFDRDVADAALAGLLAAEKKLPARLFYDEAGCRLFDAITALPEYYPTRTELALLPAIAPEISALTPKGAALVEYGACDEAKASLLLRAAAFAAYVPIDVAAPALNRLRQRMRTNWPQLRVAPVIADFLRPIVLPAMVDRMPRLGFFPGSTIGNLDPDQVRRFLRQVRITLGPGACFLVGADLCKDPEILLPAYDDAAGVTAAFNLNLLVRLNREASADFDVQNFRHEAVWNNAESRIEMHLVSRRAQTVRVDGHIIRFAAGESIHTENSYKFSEASLINLAATAGWRLMRRWTDPARLFSVVLLEQHAA